MPRLAVITYLCLFSAIAVSASAQDPLAPVKKGIHAPVPITAPEAIMPPEARRSKKPGLCIVSLIVDVNGLPQNPTIIRCSDPMFEQNSLDAVRKYRFQPARRIDDGKPAPAKITVEISYAFNGRPGDPPSQVKYELSSPPGTTSFAPDAEGIYPLAKQMEYPRMTRWVSRGYSFAAMTGPDGTACSVLMVLDAKGKPKSAKAQTCDSSWLVKPAEESLMKSKFTPALLNGSPVPVRFVIKLVYEGFGTLKQ